MRIPFTQRCFVQILFLIVFLVLRYLPSVRQSFSIDYIWIPYRHANFVLYKQSISTYFKFRKHISWCSNIFILKSQITMYWSNHILRRTATGRTDVTNVGVLQTLRLVEFSHLVCYKIKHLCNELWMALSMQYV